MTLRKIREGTFPCPHPEHEVPMHMVLSPGTWEHKCPGCGAVTVFDVIGASATSATGTNVPGHPYSNSLLRYVR